MVNGALMTTAAIGLGLGVRLVAAPLVRVAAEPRVPYSTPTVASTPAMKLEALMAALVARDPFRVARQPSPVAYDPVQLAQSATPPVPKPTLALAGIVWDRGRSPTALVEGLPGVDGPRPVRLGDTVGGLRVKSIRPDRVVITGLDTMWTLTVREPWR